MHMKHSLPELLTARCGAWEGVSVHKRLEEFEAFNNWDWVEKLKHSAEKNAVMVGAEPTGITGSIWRHI